MTSLTVWSFDTPWGADAAELRLKRLEELGDIAVHDTVVVMWPQRDKRPRVRRRRHRDVAMGTVWGGLIGTIVGGPLVGAAAGAAAGAARHGARGPVIDPAVLEQLRGEIREGTSALFVLSSGARVEAVQELVSRDPHMRLLLQQTDSPIANELLARLRSEQAGSG